MHAAAEAAEVSVALAPWLLAALYRLELGETLPVEHHAEVAEHMLAGRRA
jgi:type III secretion system FlhB-like substrate exporter